jgi:hypothetical protein
VGARKDRSGAAHRSWFLSRPERVPGNPSGPIPGEWFPTPGERRHLFGLSVGGGLRRQTGPWALLSFYKDKMIINGECRLRLGSYVDLCLRYSPYRVGSAGRDLRSSGCA